MLFLVRITMRKFFFPLFLFVLLPFFFKCASAGSFHWFQLMGGNQLWFRFVTEEQDVCPAVLVDGVEQHMDQHHPRESLFPLSCVFRLDLSNLPKSFLFENAELLPRFEQNKINRVAVIGDTGCRRQFFFSQDCEKKWFFEEIVQTLLQHNPDLVIHVGDYVYREGSENDPWEAWKLDFFLPAKKLLESNIPLLLARGNHESCARAGKGWVSLLSSQRECSDYEPPYRLSINEVEVVVTDSVMARSLLSDVADINASVDGRKIWILTHRPIVFKNGKGDYTGYVSVLENLRKEIELVISGHVHIAQLLSLDGRVQLIAGNGGAALSRSSPRDSSDSRLEHGFAIIDFQKDKIKITHYDRFDNELTSLALPR